jgi:GxxExxY protein
MDESERDPRTYAIIGAAMEVHGQLGVGFLEPVYQEALAIELRLRQIPYQREEALSIRYKGQLLCTCYRPDFICFEQIIVELKALNSLGGVEEAQVINYLKVSQFQVGLLLNFGAKSLQYRRFANSKSASSAESADQNFRGDQELKAPA